MVIKIFLFVLFLASYARSYPENKESSCNCNKITSNNSSDNSEILEPVCSTDGKTYLSECQASCEGVPILCKGECPCKRNSIETVNKNDSMNKWCDFFSCLFCPWVERPICGFDGVTYSNTCYAECCFTPIQCQGACPCEIDPDSVICDKGDMECTIEWDPICGIDGATYSNACFAEHNCIDVACEGECPCDCTKGNSPVCGVDGFTYKSLCVAEDFYEIAVECYTECPCEELEKGEECNTAWDPVCGVDENTYSNKCFAEEVEIGISCVGTCPCICPDDYEPVCSIDGETYDNSCKARRGQSYLDCEQACPCDCGGCEIQAHESQCGTDYITYFNKCQANCNNAQITCTGTCPCENVPLSCDSTKNEVCGSDGKTYDNTCYMAEGGAILDCFGSCPCSKTASVLETHCEASYKPVCGINGVTFANACTAQNKFLTETSHLGFC